MTVKNFGLINVRLPNTVKRDSLMRAKRKLADIELKHANQVQLAQTVTTKIKGEARLAEFLTRLAFA